MRRLVWEEHFYYKVLSLFLPHTVHWLVKKTKLIAVLTIKNLSISHLLLILQMKQLTEVLRFKCNNLN